MTSPDQSTFVNGSVTSPVIFDFQRAVIKGSRPKCLWRQLDWPTQALRAKEHVTKHRATDKRLEDLHLQLFVFLEKIYRQVCLTLWQYQIQQTSPHQQPPLGCKRKMFQWRSSVSHCISLDKWFWLARLVSGHKEICVKGRAARGFCEREWIWAHCLLWFSS